MRRLSRTVSFPSLTKSKFSINIPDKVLSNEFINAYLIPHASSLRMLSSVVQPAAAGLPVKG
jgi:hypothetical protein